MQATTRFFKTFFRAFLKFEGVSFVIKNVALILTNLFNFKKLHKIFIPITMVSSIFRQHKCIKYGKSRTNGIVKHDCSCYIDFIEILGVCTTGLQIDFLIISIFDQNPSTAKFLQMRLIGVDRIFRKFGMEFRSNSSWEHCRDGLKIFRMVCKCFILRNRKFFSPNFLKGI